ncbi:MAG: hypothetical protein HGA70_05155, partial [Chlorobiaceae bacterium]|nr:hypothetical protein [Chlorobiaceae bacterium]
EARPQEHIRKLLLDYCLKAVEKKIYSGWDWHTGMLRIASLLVCTDAEIERLTDNLDKEQGTGYDSEETQSIKYGLIAKTKGQKEAEAYLEVNLGNNPKLRRTAIQLSLERGEYGKAAAIAEDGIEHDRKDRPGLVIEWYDWLLKIAQGQYDRESILLYARKLFIENFRHEQDYYAILKQQIGPEMWPGYVEDLIGDIEGNKRSWYAREQIADIYIREGWLDRLLQLVSASPDLNSLSQYEGVLAKKYPSELVSLYALAVAEYLKTKVGRNHYQHACRYLRRMIKLGGKEKTNEVVTLLRAEYPQRKALMEELKSV